jgi:cytochrome c oxidase subunit IV
VFHVSIINKTQFLRPAPCIIGCLLLSVGLIFSLFLHILFLNCILFYSVLSVLACIWLFLSSTSVNKLNEVNYLSMVRLYFTRLYVLESLII